MREISGILVFLGVLGVFPSVLVSFRVFLGYFDDILGVLGVFSGNCVVFGVGIIQYFGFVLGL